MRFNTAVIGETGALSPISGFVIPYEYLHQLPYPMISHMSVNDFERQATAYDYIYLKRQLDRAMTLNKNLHDIIG